MISKKKNIIGFIFGILILGGIIAFAANSTSKQETLTDANPEKTQLVSKAGKKTSEIQKKAKQKIIKKEPKQEKAQAPKQEQVNEEKNDTTKASKEINKTNQHAKKDQAPKKEKAPSKPKKASTPKQENKPKEESKPQQSKEVNKPEASGAVKGAEQQVVELVNEARKKEGLGALSIQNSLTKVALAKAEDMAENGYFSHTSPTYGSVGNMLDTFGVGYSSYGENIAQGHDSANSVVQGWLDSPGHKANILNSNFTTIGVGYDAGTRTWVQIFIN